MSKEIWAKIKDYPDYEVSTFGRVKSVRRGRLIILKLMGENGLYLSVYLYRDESKRKNKKVHRLVAESLITNSNNRKYVNHIDGNKKNNHIENLEWVTKSEDIKHAYKNKLRFPNLVNANIAKYKNIK